jgi:CrcB protein
VPLRLLAVFLGGCLGGAARWLLVGEPDGVPWALVWVNAAGALVLVVALVVLGQRSAAPWVRPFLGTGFCGALTTFSGIVVPGGELMGDGRVGVGAAYVGASLAAGLAGGYGGLVLGRAMTRSVP